MIRRNCEEMIFQVRYDVEIESKSVWGVRRRFGEKKCLNPSKVPLGTFLANNHTLDLGK